MKKLSIAAALLSLSIAAPAFACPEGHDQAPSTAETAKPADQATAKADKAKAAKPADKAKAAKPAPAPAAKPADKVSQR